MTTRSTTVAKLKGAVYTAFMQATQEPIQLAGIDPAPDTTLISMPAGTVTPTSNENPFDDEDRQRHFLSLLDK